MTFACILSMEKTGLGNVLCKKNNIALVKSLWPLCLGEVIACLLPDQCIQ